MAEYRVSYWQSEVVLCRYSVEVEADSVDAAEAKVKDGDLTDNEAMTVCLDEEEMQNSEFDCISQDRPTVEII